MDRWLYPKGSCHIEVYLIIGRRRRRLLFNDVIDIFKIAARYDSATMMTQLQILRDRTASIFPDPSLDFS